MLPKKYIIYIICLMSNESLIYFKLYIYTEVIVSVNTRKVMCWLFEIWKLK